MIMVTTQDRWAERLLLILTAIENKSLLSLVSYVGVT